MKDDPSDFYVDDEDPAVVMAQYRASERRGETRRPPAGHRAWPLPDAPLSAETRAEMARWQRMTDDEKIAAGYTRIPDFITDEGLMFVGNWYGPDKREDEA